MELHSPFHTESQAVRESLNVHPCYAAGAARACVACVQCLYQPHKAASDAAEFLSLYGSSRLPLHQLVDQCCCQLLTRHLCSIQTNANDKK